MSAEIIIVPEAEEQLRQVHLWWLENMEGAPSMFLDEFESLTALLRDASSIGQPFRRATRPGIRRLYMPRSKYWIYYVHNSERSIVSILAVWSTRRGSAPRL
jgi:plasmid stabilization system protein ParE